MKTIPYNHIPEYPIKPKSMYYFGQLWEGNQNEEAGMEILLSGQIEKDEAIIHFTRGEINEKDFRNTIVKVTEVEE